MNLLRSCRRLNVPTQATELAGAAWRRGAASSSHTSSSDAAPPNDGDNEDKYYKQEKPTPPRSPGNLLDSMLRVDLLAQEAATALAGGRSFASHRRLDYATAHLGEQEQLEEVQRVVPQHGVRPSLLTFSAKAAFWALGTAASMLPSRLSGAVSAGVQDAMVDACNEQLRELREACVAEEVPEVRLLIRKLRDRERAPEGAPKAPDITDIRRLAELSPAEGLAALVKTGTKGMFELAKKL